MARWSTPTRASTPSRRPGGRSRASRRGCPVPAAPNASDGGGMPMRHQRWGREGLAGPGSLDACADDLVLELGPAPEARHAGHRAQDASGADEPDPVAGVAGAVRIVLEQGRDLEP